MSTYIPAYKGYIADVPEVWFKRCDKRVFHFDEITQASVNANVNFTEVNAGWSLTPVAYLPGQSTMELQMTSGQFNADMFLMANAKENFEEDDSYAVPVSETLTIDAKKITLKDTPVAGSVSIAGLAADTDFTVAEKVVTFTGDITGDVEVNYETVKAAKKIDVDNKSAAIGEAVCKWPIYGNGDDCTEKAIKGYLVMKIYKCRVTQMPGFDTSYKSAATNAVTFSAMDAKKDDGSIYNLAYIDA